MAGIACGGVWFGKSSAEHGINWRREAGLKALNQLIDTIDLNMNGMVQVDKFAIYMQACDISIQGKILQNRYFVNYFWSKFSYR